MEGIVVEESGSNFTYQVDIHMYHTPTSHSNKLFLILL